MKGGGPAVPVVHRLPSGGAEDEAPRGPTPAPWVKAQPESRPPVDQEDGGTHKRKGKAKPGPAPSAEEHSMADQAKLAKQEKEGLQRASGVLRGLRPGLAQPLEAELDRVVQR